MDEKIKIYLAIDESLKDVTGDISYSALLKCNNHSKQMKKFYNGVHQLNCVLIAFIDIMSSLKRVDIPIELYTNSSYLVKLCNGWIQEWESNNWTLKNGGKPKYKQNIMKIADILNKVDISFRYINPKKSRCIQDILNSCNERYEFL